MDSIYEFFAAALPWICMGLGATIILVNKNRKNEK